LYQGTIDRKIFWSYYYKSLVNTGGEGTIKKSRVIFIVDDDESIRVSMKLLVESAGHQGVTFESAEEFIRSGLQRDGDCMLLDVRMPGMGGFELHEYLTRSKVHIPVIFVTGYDEPGMEEKAMEAGAVGYLRKPFGDQELLDRIDRACEDET
jgi:two-component system response regulator FixJ